MLRLMVIEPNVDRCLGGKEETALYFYGESFETMTYAIAEFVKVSIVKKARVFQKANRVHLKHAANRLF